MNLTGILCRIQEDIVTVTGSSNGTAAEDLSLMKSLSADEIIQRFVQGIVSLAINITVAIIVFYLGKFIINKIYSVVGRLLLKRQVDSSLMTFVLSFVKIVLYFILIVTVIGILGIETSSFLALFASAGVAIGMALSGTLQNFAGGVLILLLKPYKVGEYIEAQGFGGTVKEIQIFHTVIITFDNKCITIPNGPLSTGSINNWNREEARRIDWTVGISYGDSVAKAREAILNIINEDPRILHPQKGDDGEDKGEMPVSLESPENVEVEYSPGERRSVIYNFFMRRRQRNIERQEFIRQQVEAKMPNPVKEPAVVVNELADSSVVLKARAWVKTADYWDVFYHLYEQIYTRLPDAGVTFPFPQLDVHFDKEKPVDN